MGLGTAEDLHDTGQQPIGAHAHVFGWAASHSELIQIIAATRASRSRSRLLPPSAR